MKKTNLQRRKLLKYAGIGIAGAVTYPSWTQAASELVRVNRPSADFLPDVEIELTMNTADVAVLQGEKTHIWKITGKVIKGPSGVLDNNEGTYLAPTLSFKKGQKVRLILNNNLPAQSILHWHGLHVPANMDGNPMYAIDRGETYVYEFEILNRAGTYFYHSHTHSVTARQVYSGLAGLLIVSDDQEQALNLPNGDFDVPLVIQDRSFDDQNQLVYSAHMMQRMQGFLGDQILVNGKPNFVLPVATRAYRLRLVNGSNSRIYKLAWDDGTPLTVIGVDGGLLESPEQHAYVMLSPGERVEVWMDFSGRAVGNELTMRSLQFDTSAHGAMGMMGGGHRGMMGGGMMGGRHRGMMGGGMMGGGMMSVSALPSGSDYPLLKIRVAKKEQGNNTLPKILTPITALHVKNAANAANPRTIALSMEHMSALLNGRSYKMDDVQPDEIIPVNSLQLIEFDNGFGGGMHGMMNMPHPMHLHGEQFQIVKREISSGSSDNYATVASGFVNSGWKDTVLVMPGEKVTILKPFNDFKGLFMYHCHNLEHEDMGMMRDFLIN
ncbi:multicopper oxidase domain-containing protein [Methylobacter sp.]|uniref:multicopper oxidase family protein n=1 Tax=Methylobacter sp. TaxID=2051955 RepID=UPI001206E337|nr:multicopper oxidase domain-containing protein [Methylobacter sp.]TAK65036.1 MAG: multicopper oxidase family protein [Methylobacter sp.]